MASTLTHTDLILIQARQLINQERYVEARDLLEGVDHPKAKKWLASVEELIIDLRDVEPDELPFWMLEGDLLMGEQLDRTDLHEPEFLTKQRLSEAHKEYQKRVKEKKIKTQLIEVVADDPMPYPISIFMGIMASVLATGLIVLGWSQFAFQSGNPAGYTALGLGAVLGIVVPLFSTRSDIILTMIAMGFSLFGTVAAKYMIFYTELTQNFTLSIPLYQPGMENAFYDRLEAGLFDWTDMLWVFLAIFLASTLSYMWHKEGRTPTKLFS